MIIVDQRYVNASSVHILSYESVVHYLRLQPTLTHPISLYHTHLQMVDVAVEGGGIRGDANGGKGCWGEGLGLAKDVGSGFVAVSLSLL